MMGINRSLDEVITMVNDLCLVSNNDIKESVRVKIHEAIGNIKISMNTFAVTIGISRQASHMPPSHFTNTREAIMQSKPTFGATSSLAAI